jgi:SNF family Na+-dependent transporter
MCIVVTCDCFTGVFAGFAVFATIGFLAKALNESINTYANAAGPGLAFITYPEAVSNMPASPFFSIIFFAMLLALGLGSQVNELFCLIFNSNSDLSFLVCVD